MSRRYEAHMLMPNRGQSKVLPKDLLVAGEDVSAKDFSLAQDLLWDFLHRQRGRSEVEFAKNRYRFHAVMPRWPHHKLVRGEYILTNMSLIIEPLGGRLEEGQYHAAKVYKYPPALKTLPEVPDDRDLSFRGMSWEEWQFIRKTGTIASAGWYNLGQEGYTFFGREAGQAEHYASGFAPWLYKPGKKCPGVVIAIPRAITHEHSYDPKNIPADERAIFGAVDASVIVGVWYLIPLEIYTGQVEIERNEYDRVDIYNGSTPSVYHTVIAAEDW